MPVLSGSPGCFSKPEISCCPPFRNMALFESIFARSRNSVCWISHALISTVNALRSASQTDATRPMRSTRLDFVSWLIGLAYTDVSAESRCVVFNEGHRLECQAAVARIPIHKIFGSSFMS